MLVGRFRFLGLLLGQRDVTGPTSPADRVLLIPIDRLDYGARVLKRVFNGLTETDSSVHVALFTNTSTSGLIGATLNQRPFKSRGFKDQHHALFTF